MDQVNLSRTLATGASYYAGVGGIAPDGSVTQSQLDQSMIEAYNGAYNNVLNSTYYNTQMLLEDQHQASMDNLSMAIDTLVDATATFATVGAVAEMAAEASLGDANKQVETQEMLEMQDMTITEADVAEYNAAVTDVEKYAQEAAGFLAASRNTSITNTVDSYADQYNVNVAQYTAVTYDATIDLLYLEFASQSAWQSISFEGYMYDDYKTAEDIYNTGIAYGG